jgi:hypothetical protein
MVDAGGQAFDPGEGEDAWLRDAESSAALLPALDSPANWGHWLAWCWGRELVVDVEPAEDEPVFTVTLGCSDGPKYSAHGTFASALLQALCEEADMGVQSFPPSVLAWWKEHGQ